MTEIAQAVSLRAVSFEWSAVLAQGEGRESPTAGPGTGAALGADLLDLSGTGPEAPGAPPAPADGGRSTRISLQVALLEFHAQSARRVGSLLGSGPGGPQAGGMADLLRSIMEPAFAEEPEAPEAEGWLDRMRALYTPERTAMRIFGFAVSGFGRVGPGAAPVEGEASGEVASDARERYREYILPAIERGHDAARSVLGALDEEVAAGIGSTMDLVRAFFERFVQGEPVESILSGESDETDAPASADLSVMA